MQIIDSLIASNVILENGSEIHKSIISTNVKSLNGMKLAEFSKAYVSDHDNSKYFEKGTLFEG